MNQNAINFKKGLPLHLNSIVAKIVILQEFNISSIKDEMLAFPC